jgi:hypothetical protein
MFTVELYAGIRRAVMVMGLAAGRPQRGLAFIATRFRRCCSFLSYRAIGAANDRRRRSSVPKWRGLVLITHGGSVRGAYGGRWLAR